MQRRAFGNRRGTALAAVIAAMVVVNLVYGLTLPLLSLVLDARGFSNTVIGMSIVAQACAGMVLAPMVPGLLKRWGPARLMQFSTVLAAMALLSLSVTQNVLAWFPLRFVLGAASAILWSASEAVINELVDERWRGRIIGVYGAAGAAGFAMGPLILVATGSQGVLPFLVTAGFILLAGIPLLWLGRENHYRDEKSMPGVWRMFRLAPEIMMLNFVYAAAVEAFLAFFALYGIEVGIGEARSLALLTVFGLGGVVLQLPLGWLADHVNRTRLLLFCLALTAAGFIHLPLVVFSESLAPAFLFVLGGVEAMIYSMGVILLGQRFRGVELATASVLFTGMWGMGTMFGPAAVGLGMDKLGAVSMTWLIGGLYLMYLPAFWFSHRIRRDE